MNWFFTFKLYHGFGDAWKIGLAIKEKSAASSREEDFSQRRNDQHSSGRGSSFVQRDSRARQISPDPSYPDKSTSDKNEEPSEVLWIGFPALLKVDELILRKAFSPFGEIEKISAFPGRTYAFVRFKNVMAACRAKETLQGKLFGNPRVRICFAKSESGTSSSGRNSSNAPPSPHFRSHERLGSSENFGRDRDFGNLSGDPSMRPLFIPNMEPGDPDVMSLKRKGNLWVGGNGAFEQRRFQELDSDLGIPGIMYERRSSPPGDRGTHFQDFSPQQFPRKGPFDDDPWDLPEDALLFRGTKKLKTSSFPPENELPEYPFNDSEQVKHVLPRIYPDFPQPEALDKNFDSGPFCYKQITDRAMNLTQPYGERSDHWNASYDGVHGVSVSLRSNPTERKRLTPESRQPSLGEEWKWEGTIAKGGTAICRARCFPVGKTLDMNFPEFLDCTARTSLDMLAKHYYQAASAWVVFFVPADDPDIVFYNEFLNYLGEKQRAAVAKLDEKTTLFLVPPSEFSEKVLKVPGKLSVSGVVLRLEHPASDSGPPHHPHEKKDTNFRPFNGDPHYPTSPPGPYSSVPAFPNIEKPVQKNTSFHGNSVTVAPPVSVSGSTRTIGNMRDAFDENRHEYTLNQRNPSLGQNWSLHGLQNSNSGTRSTTSQASSSAGNPIVQGYNLVMPRAVQESSSSNYSPEMSRVQFGGSSKLSLQESKAPVSSSMPNAALQAEQLAQLASSLLGQQQRQPRGMLMGEDFRQSSNLHQSENTYTPSQIYAVPHNQVSSELSSSYFDQGQQLQLHQTPNVPTASQRELQTGAQLNQQPQSSGTQEEVEADPQKRLQATLQLAAALLQQIQQGKGT
ncbi:unnamed protein product [Ilex paraguariensis]|uniref:RRM domain-containing protein n=1 Tax=Ilex paraguariensis TaxID=185542 RepID=A0ABC8ST88_9AQUA